MVSCVVKKWFVGSVILIVCPMNEFNVKCNGHFKHMQVHYKIDFAVKLVAFLEMHYFFRHNYYNASRYNTQIYSNIIFKARG